MVELTKVLGKIITCTAKVCTPGATAESMTENTSWTKSMGMVFIIGQTAADTRGTGVTVNNMVRANTSCLMELLK
jgi:hypothetical protein